MASAPPSIDVDQEVLCPICKDYLIEPVTLDCGHNYCQGCITYYCRIWEKQDVGDLECPVCRVRIQKGDFHRNFQLANIVEKIKLLPLNERLEDLCKTHNEKLHLFCKEDGELVCFLCERSPEHKWHTVVLKEEAAQEYKTVICGHLEHLRKKREKILAYEAKIGKESHSLLKLTETERQKTVERFRQLHQFLEEQEKRLLNEIEKMEKEITRRRDEHLDRLSKELSSLERSIREMEEKSQQPVSELLQHVRSTLQRCQQMETFKDPMAFLPELNRKISNFWFENPILYVEMKKIKDFLSFGRLQRANVTLDPDTAHPSLILSEDQKSVRKRDKPQALPTNPERFNDQPCVLGREGFTTGRHFWEVDVESKEGWAVGVARKSVERKGLVYKRMGPGIWACAVVVARESVRRKGYLPIWPEEEIWAEEKWGDTSWAFTSPYYSLLCLSEEHKRIRVTLDYEGGRVSFSDADSGAEFYTFSGAKFSGETLLPFFYLGENKTHLRIS
ncbi:tripartite motif-containing protein 10-like isoform X1 [Zootoca vivipara]|uniref:tripartite motif-containing protein 10-like isoform X1 n=1 Tax=Zootoca vivipara TaxID=8524 RepID=UPI00293BB256|nr:tripartite motif-containing protein 10-like isoform X1 [Zootoca vivipara]XP_060126737.1 tripartite motif-containing protein 10-like isoform X1 [Zootoca vivipara]XP_060126739.1 tripartite motif-containing protein 10-like isoform X1 [Zootoca vivipara]